jgi:hypothetical protein
VPNRPQVIQPLDVQIARAVTHVLDYRGCEINGLLSRIPPDVTLADDGVGDLIAEGGPAWELWQLLHDIEPRPQDRNRLGESRRASCWRASARS